MTLDFLVTSFFNTGLETFRNGSSSFLYAVIRECCSKSCASWRKNVWLRKNHTSFLTLWFQVQQRSMSLAQKWCRDIFKISGNCLSCVSWKVSDFSDLNLTDHHLLHLTKWQTFHHPVRLPRIQNNISCHLSSIQRYGHPA